MPRFSWSVPGSGGTAPLGQVFGSENLLRSALIGAGYLVISDLGLAFMGASLARYLIGFPVLYSLSWLSLVIAGNSTVSY